MNAKKLFILLDKVILTTLIFNTVSFIIYLFYFNKTMVLIFSICNIVLLGTYIIIKKYSTMILFAYTTKSTIGKVTRLLDKYG